MRLKAWRSGTAKPGYQAPPTGRKQARPVFSTLRAGMSRESTGTETGARDPEAKAERRREWLLLLVLAAVQFCHIMDFVIVMPLGPQLMRSFRITPEQFGLIVSAYTFSAAVSGLLAAFFMDRFDRKTALLGLLAGFGVGTLLCALAPSYPFLLAARVAAGAFGGVLAAVVFAIVGDQIPPARRGTAMGIVTSGFSAASVLGLPVGLFLAAQSSWHAPFYLLAATTAAVIALGFAALPPMRAHLAAERRPALAEVVGVVREPGHLRAFALTVGLMFGGFTVTPFLSPYLVANVGVKEAELSFVYLFGGLFTLLSGPLAGRLADRYGHARVFMAAALLSLVPILAVTHLPRVPLWVALVATTVLMMGFSARMVPSMALVTGSVEPRRRGGFMSVNSSIQQMSAGLAAMLAGQVVGGSASTGITRFGTVGLIAAGVTLLCLPLAARIRPAEAPAPLRPAARRTEETDAGRADPRRATGT
jgi:predicted MFS family arabinose efflux permease